MERLVKIVSDIAQLNLDGQIINRQAFRSKSGGSCDVFTAWSKKHQMKVAVKQFREFKGDNSQFAKRLAKEILVWTSLKHKNVLLLLGYFTAEENRMPSLVSEWMEKGTMSDYMKTFPCCSDETQRLLLGVASGLLYLHDNNVIHADLKSGNILISANKTPLLADFGLSLVISQSSDPHSAMTSSTAMCGGTVRWMAQELFISSQDETIQKHDRATDIWAYGMVIYEMLTLNVPYAEKPNDYFVIIALSKGELPTKPKEVGDSKVFNMLWKICGSCWGERSSRPNVANIVYHLSQSHDNSSEPPMESDQLSVLDLAGQIGDISFITSRGCYKATNRRDGSSLAVKVLRLVATKPEEMKKEATEWIALLSNLSHPNVLSLVGFYCEGCEYPNFFIASEWMESWNVVHHMGRYTRGGVEMYRMAIGITSGLSYLLSKGLLYIQLRCSSILVSSNGSPLLCNFYDDERGGHLMDLDLRWMEPELLYASLIFDKTLKFRLPLPRPSPESTVWALGMIFHELLTGEVPYSELRTDNEVKLAILSGQTPTIKTTHESPSIYEDKLQLIYAKCLSLERPDRPTVEQVLQDLNSITSISRTN